jgi:hypothetical protein
MTTALRFLVALLACVAFLFSPLHLPTDAWQDLRQGACCTIAMVVMLPVMIKGPGWLLRFIAFLIFLPPAFLLVSRLYFILHALLLQGGLAYGGR